MGNGQENLIDQVCGGGENFALMAPGAKPAAFAREGQEVFVGAVVAADSGEAPFEGSAVEEVAEDFGDDRAKGPEVGLVDLGIGFNQGAVVPPGTLPKW